MELLDQPAYAGPPPRYAAGQTVYYRGLAYTVDAVCGRAPLVGWTYQIDGPGELITVGEGEISDHAPTTYAVTERIAGRPTLTYKLTINGRDFTQYLIASPSPVYGGWSGLGISDPLGWAHAVTQQAADEEETVCQLAALSGQTVTVCRAALQDYVYGAATLIDQLKRGTVEITPDGDVVATNYRPYDSLGPPILAHYTADDPPPQPRLNRAARRSKHQRWTPPGKG